MTLKPYFNEAGEVVPFAELMSLERVDARTFRSRVKPYAPTGGENGAYGGHVYAQSAWAAAQTVPEGMIIHNITGWFTLGGIPTVPFVYRVHTIRDGGNYCVRSVTVTQIAEKGVCFTATCSFKRAETSPFRYQDTLDLKSKYAGLLDTTAPFDHPDMPSQDSWWYRMEYLPNNPQHFNPLGGLHLRKVDMEAWNKPRKPMDRRQLVVYSLRGSLPKLSPDLFKQNKPKWPREANLHALAHVYASDRNSLFAIGNHLDISKDAIRIASISHTVIFHVGVEDMLMSNEPASVPSHVPPTQKNVSSGPDSSAKERRWYVQELWTDRAEGGRGIHNSRIWNPDTGVHVATTIQDGLVRFRDGTAPKF